MRVCNCQRKKYLHRAADVFDLGKQPAENKVHIIDPNGEIVLTHVKYGGNDFEGSLKGDGVLQTVDTPYGKLSAVICWDADFPTVIKQAGEQNVDLLFVPANDWREVKDIHAGMATFRAVENGMSIFRQTGEGVSVVVDAYGTRHQSRGYVRRKRERLHWHSKCPNTDRFCEHAVSIGW
jgi:apolipoprotein N-acyltransferase